jgi:two-component system sensor histidine kinase BarA
MKLAGMISARYQIFTVWVFAIALLLAFSMLTSWRSVEELRLEKSVIDQGNANLAKSLEAHTRSILSSAEQVVRFVRSRYEESGQRLDLNSLVRRGEIDDRHFNQIGIINEKAILIASTASNFSRVDLSDREHFRVHVDNDLKGKVFVSRPVKGRASGKWSIQLTGRINKPDGSFGGVVVVSVDPQIFTRVYQNVDVGASGLIALIGDDGVIRVRGGGSGVEVTGSQLDVASSPLFGSVRGADSGMLVGRSEIDQVERRNVWMRIAGYPLMVLVGVSLDEALADYRARMRTYLQFYLLLVAVLVLFAVAATRMLQRIQRSLIELSDSRALAEEANAAKGLFLASMSHELRTPLTAILGYAEALCEEETYGPLTGLQRRGLRRISESGDHLLALVSDVLDMVKLQGGKVNAEICVINADLVARSCLQVIEASASKKAIRLDYSVRPGLPPFEADERWLRQILINLLSNAVKFSPVGGAIRLEVTFSSTNMQFSVVDNGTGISATDLVKLFKPFVQLDAGLDRKHDGSGLGLALSQGLAESMSGQISVLSKPGEGSCFCLELPLVPSWSKV